jgi:hypothetical protein
MVATAFSLIAVGVWAYIASVGVSAIHSIAEQHAPGYPNAGQIGVFAALPLLVTILLAFGAFVANRKKSPGFWLAGVAVASLVFAPAFVMVYAGGV